MTEQELKDYGYMPQDCKMGKFFFKTPFAVKLNGNVAKLYNFDEAEVGEANTVDELKQLEAKQYLKELSMYRLLAALAYGKIVNDYPDVKEEANRVFQTELNAFRKANQNWYETNFDPSIDREKIFLDEIINKYMHITTAFG